MSSIIRRFLAGLALAGLSAVSARAPAEPVKPTAEWKGSVADVTLMKAAPADGVLAGRKAFEDLWKAWKVGGKVPGSISARTSSSSPPPGRAWSRSAPRSTFDNCSAPESRSPSQPIRPSPPMAIYSTMCISQPPISPPRKR